MTSDETLRLAAQWGTGAALALSFLAAVWKQLSGRFFPWAAGLAERGVGAIENGFKLMREGFDRSDEKWRVAVKQMHDDHKAAEAQDITIRHETNEKFQAAISRIEGGKTL